MPSAGKFRHWRRRWVLLGAVLVALLFALLSRYGVLMRWRIEQRYRAQQQHYERLQAEVDSLRQLLYRLRTRPAAEIERLARERYGMVRPGETLYVVDESTAVLDARGR